LIHLETTDKLQFALNVLIKKNFYCIPVFSKNEKAFVGFVDLVDIVTYIVSLFDEKSEEFQNMEENRKKYQDISLQTVMDLSKRNPIHKISENSSLYEAMVMFENTSAHRLLVIRKNDADVVHILTQSNIITWLSKHLNHFEEFSKTKIQDLNLTAKEILTVRTTDLILFAFQLMAKNQVSAVPVVNPQGSYVGIISAKDLTVIQSKDTFSELFQTCGDYFSRWTKPGYLSPENTLSEMLLKLHALKVHRLVILDDQKKVIGMVSLGYIIRILVNRMK